jgi:hypothetical protein
MKKRLLSTVGLLVLQPACCATTQPPVHTIPQQTPSAATGTPNTPCSADPWSPRDLDEASAQLNQPVPPYEEGEALKRVVAVVDPGPPSHSQCTQWLAHKTIAEDIAARYDASAWAQLREAHRADEEAKVETARAEAERLQELTHAVNAAWAWHRDILNAELDAQRRASLSKHGLTTVREGLGATLSLIRDEAVPMATVKTWCIQLGEDDDFSISQILEKQKVAVATDAEQKWRTLVRAYDGVYEGTPLTQIGRTFQIFQTVPFPAFTGPQQAFVMKPIDLYDAELLWRGLLRAANRAGMISYAVIKGADPETGTGGTLRRCTDAPAAYLAAVPRDQISFEATFLRTSCADAFPEPANTCEVDGRKILVYTAGGTSEACTAKGGVWK